MRDQTTKLLEEAYKQVLNREALGFKWNTDQSKVFLDSIFSGFYKTLVQYGVPEQTIDKADTLPGFVRLLKKSLVRDKDLDITHQINRPDSVYNIASRFGKQMGPSPLNPGNVSQNLGISRFNRLNFGGPGLNRIVKRVLNAAKKNIRFPKEFLKPEPQEPPEIDFDTYNADDPMDPQHLAYQKYDVEAGKIRNYNLNLELFFWGIAEDILTDAAGSPNQVEYMQSLDAAFERWWPTRKSS